MRKSSRRKKGGRAPISAKKLIEIVRYYRMGYGFHSTARKAGVSPSTVKRYIRELKDLL